MPQPIHGLVCLDAVRARVVLGLQAAVSSDLDAVDHGGDDAVGADADLVGDHYLSTFALGCSREPDRMSSATRFADDKLNVNGGSVAIGHPLGSTGARMLTDLLCELERSGKTLGLQTICEANRTANTTIIERLAR